jgi:hypothetical protein
MVDVVQHGYLQILSNVLYAGSENAEFLTASPFQPRPKGLDRNWAIVAVHEGVTRVRAEPFDAIELDLGILWADVDLGRAR